MKNYDDLQRFKEKTQTQDINFRDMSGQSVDTDASRWAIIQQLSTGKTGDDVLANGQRVDRAQPQPIRAGAFTAPASVLNARASEVQAAPGSLLQSVAASLEPAASLLAQQAAQPAPAASLLAQSAAQPAPAASLSAQSAAQPAPAASLLAQSAAQPAPAASLLAQSAAQPAPSSLFSQPTLSSRFGGLFRAHHAGPATLSKETLLKPLLEKIALCR